MKSQPLRLLIVENDVEVADRLVRELRGAGFDPEWQRVETLAEFVRHLHPGIELILSDYVLPAFSGPRALELLRASGLEIPFILVSDTIGEERAVEVMKQGASDCLSKDRLARLGSAVSQALERFRLRLERWRGVEKFAFVGLFSVEGEVLELNDASLAATGLRREEMIGRHFIDTCWWADRPDAQGQVRRAVHRAMWGETVREDFTVRVAEGRMAIVDATFGPLRDAEGQITEVVASAVDVTASRQVQAALRDAGLHFRQIIENVREVFWMTDVAKEQILYISPGCERIWGRSCVSLAASPSDWLTAIHPEDRARVELAVKTRQITGEYDEVYRIVRPDESVCWIRDRAFPVTDSSGTVYRLAGMAEDITERKQLETQCRQSQKMEAIGQLASSVAHDFNNLLTVILGNGSLLLDQADESHADYAQRLEIVQAAERAASLTQQLLLFSRKQEMRPQEIDLNTVVTEMSRMLQRLLLEDVALRTETMPDLPLIHADTGMVEQILLNLAVNARDAMVGGGALVIATRAETIDARRAQQIADATPGDYVCLSVSDFGTGIPPELLPRIFEPFFTTKEAGKGTGLGLATVYGIVRQHRGWITVESRPGEGTTFQIYFPALERRRPASVEVQEISELPSGHETILLVEDDSPVRLIVRTALERCGYRALPAASGIDALEVWRTHASKIQLLLTDMVMPDRVSGRDLAERLRLENPGLKIIYTSGHGVDVVGKDLSLVDGFNFLQKPYNLHKLAHTVRTRLDAIR
jgi:PAS domain S-box-containing protein